MRWMPIPFTLTLLALAGSPAAGQAPKKPYDPKVAFAETDTNGDGVIDQGEMYARIVEVFYFADTNKDGYLSAEELQQLPFPDDFKAADKDGDGRISLREYMRVREEDFDAADTDHDKVLTLEEVITAYEGKKK